LHLQIKTFQARPHSYLLQCLHHLLYRPVLGWHNFQRMQSPSRNYLFAAKQFGEAGQVGPVALTLQPHLSKMFEIESLVQRVLVAGHQHCARF
jgi:hypothetical protein